MPSLVALVAIAFIAGVFVQDAGFARPAPIIVAGLFATAFVWTGDRRWVSTGVMVTAVFILGALRVAGETSPPIAQPELARANQFEGTVAAVPRHYPGVSFVVVELHDPADTTVWSQLPPFPIVRQGDQVRIAGDFTPFPQARLRGFAAKQNTSGVLNGQQVMILGNIASPAQRVRNAVSETVRESIQTRVPEPAGAFTVGMLLGDDGAMTEATRHSFRVGGMTHLTAVSGLHVGIVAAGILLLSRFGLVHRWVLLVAAVPLIWMFAYLVGFRPSVVRASLMLTLFVAAQLLGRPRDTLNAVSIAAALMILVNPDIRFDIGFQLSVAATLGIALSLPLISGRSIWHTAWVVPLAAEAAVTPLILYHFGYYSLVSPLANIVAAPFVAIAMGLGILTVAVALASGVIADFIAIATWLPARAVVLIADSAASVPLLSGDIEPITGSGVLIAYIVLAGVLAALYVLIHPAFGDSEGDIGTLYRI